MAPDALHCLRLLDAPRPHAHGRTSHWRIKTHLHAVLPVAVRPAGAGMNTDATDEYTSILFVARKAHDLPDAVKRSIFAQLQRRLEQLAWTPAGDFADALSEIRAAMEY
jgi:hypothetical protein